MEVKDYVDDHVKVATEENKRVIVDYDQYAECPTTDAPGSHYWTDGGEYLSAYSSNKSMRKTLHSVLEEWVREYVDTDMMIDAINKSEHFCFHKEMIDGESWYILWNGEDEVLRFSGWDMWHSYVVRDLCEEVDIPTLLDALRLCPNISVHEWEYNGCSQGDYIHGVSIIDSLEYEEVFGTWDKEEAELKLKVIAKTIGSWTFGDVFRILLQNRICYTKVYQDGRKEECEEWETEDEYCEVYDIEDKNLKGYF